MKRFRGFSVIELTLVLAITMMGLITSLEALRHRADFAVSNAAAGHIKAVGEAVTSYVVINELTLGASSNSVITTGDLRSSGLLSPAYTNLNPWGSDYQINIKRLGASAPFSFEAIVTTATPASSNGDPRIDIAAKAAGLVGGQAGHAIDASALEGFGGTWKVSSGFYPGLSIKPATLAYYIESSLIRAADSSLLRADGLNSMLGSLSLGGNQITNANSVNAANIVGNGLVGSASAAISGTAEAGVVNVNSVVSPVINVSNYLYASSLYIRPPPPPPDSTPPPPPDSPPAGGD